MVARVGILFWPTSGTIQYPYVGRGRYILNKKRYQVYNCSSTVPLWWHASVYYFGRKEVQQYSTRLVARVGILFWPKRGTIQYPYGGTDRYILAKNRYSTAVPLWWHESVYFGRKEIQHCTVYGGTGRYILAKNIYSTVTTYGGTARYILAKRRYCTPIVARLGTFWPKRGIVPYRGTARYILTKMRYNTPIVAQVGTCWLYPYGGTGRYILA